MYSKVPEPKFNINEWFKESFPKPELYVPEPPNIESQNELHIKMYQQQLKQYKIIVERQTDMFNMLIQKWQINYHKYIEMDTKYEIQKSKQNGRRIIFFKYLNPVDDGWKSKVYLNENDSKHYGRSIYSCWSESTTPYISCGLWDNYEFSENERILAWRIECNKKTIPKTPINHGNNWKEQEEYELMTNFTSFLDIQANNHSRTPNAIKKMLQKLMI